MRLANKVACITGAGSGQGKASSVLFAGEGAKVLAADVNIAGVGDVVKTIRDRGGEATAMKVDVSREEQVADMIKKTVDTYGRIDILFNNAGVGYSSPYVNAPTVQTPVKDWDIIVGINMRSVFLGCKCVIPYMEKQGGGVIINNSSINGLVAMSGADAYTATKGGVIALTRVLAVDWAPKNIRVNCICPGAIDTPMIAPALDLPGVRDYFTSNCPMGRIGKPEEIAYTALFLASDESSYITGVIIPVDGGWTAK
jgi:NAD(P)-dependent dehydrogenase (short-subunit alcohol dehydrogenase family)